MLALASVLLAASPARATVPLGTTARDDVGVTCGDEPADLFALGTGRLSYTVRGAGTITSWTTYAGAAGGEIAFKVFRPVAPGAYTVVAAEQPRTLTPDALNGFFASIPVQPGDVIGLNDSGVPSSCVIDGLSTFALYERVGDLTVGQSGGFAAVDAGVVPNLRAYMTPSNEFSFDLSRKGRKGAVRVRATLPGPGRLGIASIKLKTPHRVTIDGAGEFERVFAPKPTTRRLLRERGRLRAKVELTYHPTGGSPSAVLKKVRLRRRAR